MGVGSRLYIRAKYTRAQDNRLHFELVGCATAVDFAVVLGFYVDKSGRIVFAKILGIMKVRALRRSIGIVQSDFLARFYGVVASEGAV